jgi:hypothetical protein
MDFSFDETQLILRDMARRFASERLRPHAGARDASGEFPEALLKEMGTMGLMGINVPGELGGAEAGVVSYSLAITEIARGDASVGVTMSVNNMVCEILSQYGRPEHHVHVERLTSGEYSSGSFCLSEPGSGSDAQAMLARATRTPEGWSLTGTKSWITSGAYAGVFIVWAKTDVDGKDRISAFVVAPDTPGVSVGAAEHKMGQHASNTVTLSFDDVQLPESALLGELGDGFKIAMTALDGGRVGVASLALGIAEEALSVALDYTTERKQFGKRIADFQNTRFKLADMATEIEAARMLTLRAAWLKQQGDVRFTKEASMAKLYASELSSRVTDAALQMFGGYGYTSEYPAERLMRDARVTRIYEGTSEIQRLVIGREVLNEHAR